MIYMYYRKAAFLFNSLKVKAFKVKKKWNAVNLSWEYYATSFYMHENSLKMLEKLHKKKFKVKVLKSLISYFVPNSRFCR